MRSPISPTASPEAWTEWLAEELAVCMDGEGAAVYRHLECQTWELGVGRIHVSTLRSIFGRRWLDPNGRNICALTDTGRAALDAQAQGQPGECSRCNGDRMVDGESMGDDPCFALVEQFPCPTCSGSGEQPQGGEGEL